MEIWVELLAVLGAIWLVVLVVQLRTVAALPMSAARPSLWMVSLHDVNRPKRWCQRQSLAATYVAG
jgi:hypothetical protein